MHVFISHSFINHIPGSAVCSGSYLHDLQKLRKGEEGRLLETSCSTVALLPDIVEYGGVVGN